MPVDEGETVLTAEQAQARIEAAEQERDGWKRLWQSVCDNSFYRERVDAVLRAEQAEARVKELAADLTRQSEMKALQLHEMILDRDAWRDAERQWERRAFDAESGLAALQNDYQEVLEALIEMVRYSCWIDSGDPRQWVSPMGSQTGLGSIELLERLGYARKINDSKWELICPK